MPAFKATFGRWESGLREVEARLGGRIDVLAAEMESTRTSFDARFEAFDRRMDEGFGALRRENRLLFLFFSTMLGLADGSLPFRRSLRVAPLSSGADVPRCETREGTDAGRRLTPSSARSSAR